MTGGPDDETDCIEDRDRLSDAITETNGVEKYIARDRIGEAVTETNGAEGREVARDRQGETVTSSEVLTQAAAIRLVGSSVASSTLSSGVKGIMPLQDSFLPNAKVNLLSSDESFQ